MASGLYSADVVLDMLLRAYRAGFDGPLELAEQMCEDILNTEKYDAQQISDAQLMESFDKVTSEIS